MIVGMVNANCEATVRLFVYREHGEEREIEAIIDTGFTGFLTLTASLISTLGLVWRGYAQAVLADGSLHLFEVYAATVVWDGRARTVEIDAADRAPWWVWA